MKYENKQNLYRGISYFSLVLLILAMPSLLPYSFYIFLRWVICLSALLLGLGGNYRTINRHMVYVWIFIAILFNPIVPIYLSKQLWIAIDVVVAILFFISTQ